MYAPDEGYITIRAQEPGANIVQGQTIYTVTKTKPVWVKAYIEESYLGNIKNNMEVFHFKMELFCSYTLGYSYFSWYKKTSWYTSRYSCSKSLNKNKRFSNCLTRKD